jgi:hypothetical protein
MAAGSALDDTAAHQQTPTERRLPSRIPEPVVTLTYDDVVDVRDEQAVLGWGPW